MRPERAKALVQNECILTLLPFQGALYRLIPPQGDALGYALTGPSARSLNACLLQGNTCGARMKEDEARMKEGDARGKACT